MLFILFHFSRISAINVSHQKPTMSQSMVGHVPENYFGHTITIMVDAVFQQYVCCIP